MWLKQKNKANIYKIQNMGNEAFPYNTLLKINFVRERR